MKKSSRVGRTHMKPTMRRKKGLDQRPVPQASRVTEIVRENGRLLINVVTPAGKPRTLEVTFG